MLPSLLLLSTLAAVPAPEPIAPLPDQAYATDVNRRARGLGLGFAQGYWGGAFGQSLRADIPFGKRVGQFFGLRLHATVVHSSSTLSDGRKRYDPTLFGGAELFGRSPVMGGLVRAYGGGGVFVGGRPFPTAEGSDYGIAGGGHMGLEVFVTPRMSFSVEVGGQGPVHALDHDAGAHVLGGFAFYFGR